MSNEPIRISAIIPAYNRGHLVGRAIESALAQTRPPDEIIVVDDGSQDDTRERVGQYTAIHGASVRYIYQENGGSAAARHTGFQSACHEWIALLDSDDHWLPNHLERMVQAIQATQGGARFYFADTVRSSEGQGQRHWQNVNFQIVGSQQLIADAADWVMMGHQPMMLQSTVFNKNAYFAVGGFWKPLRYRDDTHLYLKLGIGGAACAVNNIGCQMTDDDQNNRLTTNHSQAKRGCQMQVLMFQELLAREWPIRPTHKAILRHRLSTAHRCMARFAWRERHLGDIVWHTSQSLLVEPQSVGIALFKGVRTLLRGGNRGQTAPSAST